MCGIAGFLANGANFEPTTLGKMLGVIRHRGPDASGKWIDGDVGVALGHRRLAIVDLTDAGAQPMSSLGGRYVITFNGEIYNYGALREELENSRPIRWRGHSDTEVVVEAIAFWGVESTLRKLTGMFALAVWDRQRRTLSLARDRMGEKPLYYGWIGGSFVFASELKAVAQFPGFAREIDREALSLYMRYSCVPAPLSIYKGIAKLMPAAWCTVEIGDSRGDGQAPVPRAYWSLGEVVVQGQRSAFAGSDGDAIDQLERILQVAVAGQMMADVPLGAFLSGGIDSSVIVALMSERSSSAVKTFTIGFHENGFDEAPYAREVARHLQTDHTELYVTPKEALDVIPKLPEIFDEPFSDSSQIPTYLVSSLARSRVKVALSGDGGDELFAGYNHYALAENLWRSYAWLPRRARDALARLLTMFAPSSWDSLLGLLQGVIPAAKRGGSYGHKLHRFAALLRAAAPLDVYDSLCSHWKSSSNVVVGAGANRTAMQYMVPPSLREFLPQMMYTDALRYLPDDILVKVDRAAMAVSLETRIPLLDHKVVEFAWRLPMHMKVRGGVRKWLLRQVLYRYVPQELVERRKMGFGVPLGGWLRGPLRDWASALLDSARLRTEGFFYPEAIHALWQEHLRGRDLAYYLWDVLMFQAWLENSR